MSGTVNLDSAPKVDSRRGDGWWRRAGRWLLPPRCLLCGEAGAHGRDLCAACATVLPWNRSACTRCALPLPEPGVCGECLQRPPALTETRAAFVYGFPLDRLAPRFKFHRDLAAGRLLAELMADGLVAAPRPEALVPVPLHRRRLRRRGYDQALELARPLARTLGIPLHADLLSRQRATAPQSELDAAARQRNLRNAFAVPPNRAMPQHVALVDDVMTTGATLRAAARALLKAGVLRVDAWVCARVP
ncbi:ComF family protein [Pseudoxanthomonas sangjuensis]|uniref:ComF family protein n=1 Tax=Pseudoxanthomonas sangjuensis TaxID=1503750 RepID=UPI001390AB23|nr:ComF family protein [Pseudoxanthomonas sangjuensis]KAF1714503.1 amidophosphoribosyltransferase [Pseudoxanthomonas sangjuensis]